MLWRHANSGSIQANVGGLEGCASAARVKEFWGGRVPTPSGYPAPPQTPPRIGEVRRGVGGGNATPEFFAGSDAPEQDYDPR
jgi:hypothetical protein